MRFDHRAVPIVLAAVLIDTIGFGIVIPVFPRLITSLAHVGLPEATRIAGWLLVTFSLTQFFAGPVMGNLGDRFGRRPVLIASMLAFSADFALTAIAPTIAWLFVARAIAGVTGALYSPASAVIADVSQPEKRGATFGLIGAMFGLGFIIGPALGGLLSTLGPRAPFIAASLIALANALAMLLFLPETLARENRRAFDWRAANIVGAFRPLMQAGDAVPLILAWFLWNLAHQVYPATWAFWAAIALGWNGAQIGWSLAFTGLVMILVQVFVTGRAINLLGERKAVIVGLVSGAIVFTAFAFVRTGWIAYALFLVGALQWLVFPSMNGLLSRMADPSHQGALQGGVASMSSVSSILGPLLLTQALAAGAASGFPGAAFATAAALAGAALLVILVSVLRRVPPKDAAR